MKSTPTELTSGKGFDFEDLVGAWLTSFLLSSAHLLPNKSALINNIRFQVGNDGWLLDDILLELLDNNKKVNIALSIKSNKQFTANKAPDDLVEALWEQHLSQKNSSFDQNKDYLGIVTSPLSGSAKDALISLLQKSEHLLVGELNKKVADGQFSKGVRALHKSFECPITDKDKNGISIDHILKRFKAFQCDFYEQTSTSYTQAIANIKSSLANPSAKNASELFEKLCNLVKRYRVNGGTINYQLLIESLSKEFNLKALPDYQSDLLTLERYSCDVTNRINCTIGNKLSLIRSNELNRIYSSLEKSNIVVVLGDTGSGKSALVKRLASPDGNKNIIWFDAAFFEYHSAQESLKYHLLIEHSWKELLGEIQKKPHLIVIDGIDRLWKYEHISVVNQLVKPLQLDSGKTKVVVTCQLFHWQRIQSQLFKSARLVADAGTVNISNIGTAELNILKNQFPQFNRVIANDKVVKFLLRPKVLDLFARMPPSSLSNTSIFRSEVDLINWYWNNEVSQSEHGALKERFILKLAKLLGDQLSNTVKLSSFEVAELTALELLEKSQILYRKEGKIYFEHDIFSDWFKQRLITDELEENDSFLESCAVNPQWHRAISLYGTELVQNQSLYDKWKLLLENAAKRESYLLVDILLESILFSSSPSEVMDKHWHYLKSDNAKLLNRFFNRFLYTATEPNQQTLRLAKHFKVSELEASSINRVPIDLMWLDVIGFIIKKQNDLINLVPKNLALICKSWIINTEAGLIYRKDLAEIALKICWKALQASQHRRSHERWSGANHKNLEFYFEVAMSCVTENLSEVIKIAECASGISEPTIPLPPDPPPEPITDPEKLARWEELTRHTSFIDDEKIELPPIKDGANYEVNRTFQEFCLKSPSFTTLIAYAPEKAANILLANCIREPGTVYRYRSFDMDKGYGLAERSLLLFPPFYTKTPFLTLLNVSPEQGIKVIVRMADIATEEWVKEKPLKQENGAERLFNDGYPTSIALNLNGEEKEFLGERRWMFGSRATTTPPQLLVCALMSLEKWLFEKLNSEEEVESIVETLLKQTCSIAIVGVCFLLAKKKNDLFKSTLFGLLRSPWIYAYDLHHCKGDEGHQMIGHGMRETEHQFNLAKEWHSLEHRKLKLEDIIFTLILNDKEFRERVENELISDLQLWLDNAGKEDENYMFILRLRHQFELKNWNSFKNDKGNIQVNFNPPPELAEIQKKEVEYNDLKSLLISVPHRCVKVLDTGEEINEKDIEAIFEKIINIDVKLLESFDHYSSPTRAICAISSLIILRKDDIPSVYDKYGDECKAIIIHHCFEAGFPEPKVDESNFSIEWDRFCARALPSMLVEEPDDKGIREAVAFLFLGYHYETLSFLILAVFKVRENLPDDFYRLLNLLNLWAPLRHRIRIATNDNVYGHEKLTAEQLYEKANELAYKFVNYDLPTTLPNWGALQKTFETFEQFKQIDKNQARQLLINFDDFVILYGYSWLPTIDKASSIAEKEDWLSIYKQLSLTLWLRLAINFSDENKSEGTPYKFDYWILDKVASVLIYCSREQAAKLWKPILSLGGESEYWVTHFLSGWFSQHNINVDANHFAAIWDEMINYAKQSHQWSKNSRYWSKFHKIWKSLMGVDGFTCQSVWKNENGELIIMMESHYQFYTKNILDSYDIDSLAYFLSTPSGTLMADKGIIWIFDFISNAKIRSLKEREQSSLILLIEFQLSKTYDFNELPSANQKALIGLLKILVEEQNVKAMELYKVLCR